MLVVGVLPDLRCFTIVINSDEIECDNKHACICVQPEISRTNDIIVNIRWHPLITRTNERTNERRKKNKKGKKEKSNNHLKRSIQYIQKKKE